MNNKKVILDSVDAYCRLYGLETPYPLAAIVDLRHSSRIVNHLTVEYGLYALFLKNGVNCTLRYGRKSYDYQKGSVVSFAPGQTVEVEYETMEAAPDVIGLLFHPDLIYGTPLGRSMERYTFFDYSEREAVHLSDEERTLVEECFERIKRETELPADRHSASVISSHIQVLMEYMMRFYSRQFATRSSANSGIMARFEKELREYFAAGAVPQGVPSVSYFASRVNLTPGYFGDLVKKETGTTAQEFISSYIIARAKQRLASDSADVSTIAYDLGFQYPQHFTRLFKRVTGQSPTEFRRALHLR